MNSLLSSDKSNLMNCSCLKLAYLPSDEKYRVACPIDLQKMSSCGTDCNRTLRHLDAIASERRRKKIHYMGKTYAVRGALGPE